MIMTKNPLARHSRLVHTTVDYFMFRPIDGNRVKNLLHINRLKKSMQEHYLYTVIIVNEKYEIIDGQHRFDVISELKLPLNYIVCEGYGLKEVHILNQISKTWNADDYLAGYCSLGYKDYLLYREFKEKYGFGHRECIQILSGKAISGCLEIFFRGDFKVKDYNEACEVADKIFLTAPYYAGFKRRSFVHAMLGLLKNPNFKFEEFLQKLKTQPVSMVDCTVTTQYLELIEDIYNYRRKEKVNLRY